MEEYKRILFDNKSKKILKELGFTRFGKNTLDIIIPQNHLYFYKKHTDEEWHMNMIINMEGNIQYKVSMNIMNYNRIEYTEYFNTLIEATSKIIDEQTATIMIQDNPSIINNILQNVIVSKEFYEEYKYLIDADELGLI